MVQEQLVHWPFPVLQLTGGGARQVIWYNCSETVWGNISDESAEWNEVASSRDQTSNISCDLRLDVVTNAKCEILKDIAMADHLIGLFSRAVATTANEPNEVSGY
jgi:hypothetical protein